MDSFLIEELNNIIANEKEEELFTNSFCTVIKKRFFGESFYSEIKKENISEFQKEFNNITEDQIKSFYITSFSIKKIKTSYISFLEGKTNQELFEIYKQCLYISIKKDINLFTNELNSKNQFIRKKLCSKTHPFYKTKLFSLAGNSYYFVIESGFNLIYTRNITIPVIILNDFFKEEKTILDYLYNYEKSFLSNEFIKNYQLFLRNQAIFNKI